MKKINMFLVIFVLLVLGLSIVLAYTPPDNKHIWLVLDTGYTPYDNEHINLILSDVTEGVVKLDSQTSLLFDIASPQDYLTAITPNCSLITGDGTPVLTQDSVVITSGVALILGADTYSFKCYMAETTNYSYSENVSSYIINQISPVSNMSLTGTTPIVYTTTSDFAESETNTGDGGCSYSLDLSNDIYGVGTWTFNYSTAGCTNYTTGSVTKDLVVTVNDSLVVGITGTTPITYGTTTDVAGTDCPAQLSCALDKTNAVYGVGTETFNYSTAGNTNYSSASITKDIIINQASTSCEVKFNETSPITYLETFLVWSNCDTDFVLRRDGTIITNNTEQVLGAGTYNFSVKRTDNINYSNIGNDEDFVIDKATLSGTATGTTPITYLTAGDAEGTENNAGDGDVVYKLYREGLESSNPDTDVLAVGVYNYIYNSTGGENYSTIASIDTFALTVNKKDPSTNMDITGTTPITYLTVSDFVDSETNTGDANCIYSMDRGNEVYGVDTWTFNYSTAGCENYTSGEVTKDLVVNQNTTINLSITGTTPITYGTTTDVAGSGCPSELSCSLDKTNVVYSAGSQVFNYSTQGNTNYTGSSVTKNITINKATLTGNLTNTGTWVSPYPTEITIGLSETNTGDGDVTYVVYRDNVSKGTGETVNLSVGIYNYTLNSTGGVNWSTNPGIDSQILNVTIINQSLEMNLEGLDASLPAVELGTLINVSYTTDELTYFDIDHPDYGTNSINDSTSGSFNLNISYFRLDKTNESLTEVNLTMGFYPNLTEISNSFLNPDNGVDYWSNNALIHDGDFSTWSASNGGGTAYYYFNYTIPKSYTSDMDTLIEFKDASGIYNRTIPSSCIQNNQINLAILSSTLNLLIACINETGGVQDVQLIYNAFNSNNDLYEKQLLFIEPKSIGISSHQYDRVDNFKLNITSTGLSALTKIYIYINNILSNIIQIQDDLTDFNLTKLNDGNSDKLINITEAGLFDTQYFNIPKAAILTSATFNVTGLQQSKEFTQEYFNQSTDDGGQINTKNPIFEGTWNSASKSLDGDYSTYATAGLLSVTSSEYYYVNYSKPNDRAKYNVTAKWTIKAEIDGNGTLNRTYTIKDECYNMFDNEISLAVFFDTNAAVSISQRTFCYNGTWQLMGTVNTAGVQPMKFYEEAINWSYDSTYPNYTYLEVGTSDGNREWNMVGELTTENNTGNWSSAIQTYLGTCTADGNGNCQVPIQFGSKTRGKINISKIQVLYNFNPNPIELNVTLIKDFLSSSNEFVDIPLKFIPETNCTLTVNDLRFDHAGGNDTLAVLAHTVGYASSVSHDITYFYSAWNYSMPKYIDYLEFLPNTATSRNVTPYGQTYGKPILNFTSYQYGGQLANISIYINDTFECVNISIGINTTKPVNRIENDTWTNLNTSMDYLDSFGNWMYADFNCNYSQWNLFNPTYYFRACCTDCICSEEVI